MSNFATEIAKYLHKCTQNGDKTGVKLVRINLLTKKVVFLHILFVPLHPQIKKAPIPLLKGFEFGQMRGIEDDKQMTKLFKNIIK